MIEHRPSEQAQSRTFILVLVCFLAGLGAGAYWYHRATHRHAPNIGEPGVKLAESTRAVLRSVETPVELRYFSSLDPASTPESLRAFAQRVDQLLADYEREAGGKIKLTRYPNVADAAAASAAGVKSFNLDKGDPCFLGVAVSCNDQKEVLNQLSPEWEAALESDLSRAIARVASAKAASKAAIANAPQIDAAATEEVKQAIPNLGAISLTEGKQALRVAAVKEIMAATEEMQRLVKEAQANLGKAQASGSEAEQQTAMKQLQQVQVEQTEKLKQLAARAQARVEALEQLKAK